MNKSERCERCPDEHTDACDTCREPEPEQSTMKLTYTFHLAEGISEINGLHSDLDDIVQRCCGIDVIKSTLESPDEICEHDYREGADTDAWLD